MEVKEIIEAIGNDLEYHSKELKPKYKKALIMAIMLLKKEIPKKMENYQCPDCRHYFEDGEPHTYCPCCGQKLSI